MELHDFLVEVVTPKAVEEVTKRNSGGKILIGEGNPYFEELTQAKNSMVGIYKEVIEGLVGTYKAKLDRAFYELKTIDILTRPLLNSESNEFVVEQVKKAQNEVNEAFKQYKLALQAESYIKNYVR